MKTVRNIAFATAVLGLAISSPPASATVPTTAAAFASWLSAAGFNAGGAVTIADALSGLSGWARHNAIAQWAAQSGVSYDAVAAWLASFEATTKAAGLHYIMVDMEAMDAARGEAAGVDMPGDLHASMANPFPPAGNGGQGWLVESDCVEETEDGTFVPCKDTTAITVPDVPVWVVGTDWGGCVTTSGAVSAVFLDPCDALTSSSQADVLIVHTP